MLPIIESLFAEMTILGFLSVITFVCTKVGVLEMISLSAFGDGDGDEHEHEENKEKLTEIFEVRIDEDRRQRAKAASCVKRAAYILLFTINLLDSSLRSSLSDRPLLPVRNHDLLRLPGYHTRPAWNPVRGPVARFG